MKIRRIDQPDICWRAEAVLNIKEWPIPLDEQGAWLDRPIRKWVYDNLEWGDHFFGARGSIYFKNSSDAEWFRMVWEQEI